jgi:small subunit ribosomal protein S16
MGALPSERVHRFLGDAGLTAKPEIRERPKKSAPRAKAQERAKGGASAPAPAEAAPAASAT